MVARKDAQRKAGTFTFHITVFELSYLERDGWRGAEHVWLWAGGGSTSNRIFAVNASIDQAAISLAVATLMVRASDSNANGDNEPAVSAASWSVWPMLE
jgi:hypothetical protein